MVKKTIDIFTRFRTNVKEFAGVMRMPLQTFRKLGDSAGRLDKNLTKNASMMGRVGLRLRHMTHGMRGFRMEMLGVMFFGMGIMRFFQGLLRPAGEMVGVFELLSLALALLFLPTALELLDWVIKFLGWVTGLDEEQKKSIGTFVVWGAVLGTITFLIGMFALGIGSLILAFGWLFGIVAPGASLLKFFGGIFPTIGKAIGGLSVIFAVVLAVIIGFILAWKENFAGIREWVQVLWEGIKDIFGGAVDVITGLMNVFFGLFSGDPKKIWEGVKSIFSGIWRIIRGAFKFLLGLVVTLGISLFRVVAGVIKTGFKIGEWLAEIVKKVVKNAFGQGSSWIMSFFNGLKSIGSKIIDWFKGLLPDWVKKAGGKFLGFLGGEKKTVSPSPLGDFLLRPGQPPIAFSPDDTIVGTKGGVGLDTESIVRAIEGIFARLEITVNAPSGYDVTARMGGI